MNDVAMLNTMLELGLIDTDQRQIAWTENRRQGTGIREVLLANGFVDEETFTELASRAAGVEVADLSGVLPDSEALRRLPAETATQYEALPLSYCAHTNSLEVCVAELGNVLLLDALRSAVEGDVRIEFQLASRSDILKAQDRFYGFKLSIDEILAELEDNDIENDDVGLSDDRIEHPIIRLVDALLVDACKHRASDIHFEPEAGFLRIRYRVDGVMKLVRCIHKKYWAGCVVRLKVLSGLNIAETRSPQDGAFSVRFSTQRVDIRLSAFPTLFGENIVLRLLDASSGIQPLKQLGFDSLVQQRIDRAVKQPHGVILVVGPTGCGKTTTLYSILSALNTEQVNIVTLEDPVEYTLPMVRQCSVNSSLKMDFAEGLRSILRQDPDIILVGEIRDTQTAELTFRAAMTGHQVFASVHACSAAGAYQRLFELGLPREQVFQQITAIVSQRLLRRLCEHCKEPQAFPDDASKLSGSVSNTNHPGDKPQITACNPVPNTIYRASGCQHCNRQGYKGRLAVAEVMFNASSLERKVDSSSVDEITTSLNRTNSPSLQQSALALVRSGLTSIEEVERVTGPISVPENTGQALEQHPASDGAIRKSAGEMPCN